jgi:hypothetical protein
MEQKRDKTKIRKTGGKSVTNREQDIEIYSCQILFLKELISFGGGGFPWGIINFWGVIFSKGFVFRRRLARFKEI